MLAGLATHQDHLSVQFSGDLAEFGGDLADAEVGVQGASPLAGQAASLPENAVSVVDGFGASFIDHVYHMHDDRLLAGHAGLVGDAQGDI
jgi:hypothetical protein